MCEPVSITMAVGMAVSMAMTMAQQKAAADNQRGMINARNNANIAEAERQEMKQKEADTVFGDALAKYQGNEAQNREEAANENREEALVGAADVPGSAYNPSFGSQGGPQVIKGELARKTGQVISAGKDSAKRLAKLGGNKDFGFGNMIELGRTGGQLGDISALSRGSAALLPIEQQTAITNAYNPPSPWLEVGKQAGRGLQAYGAYGAGGAGAGAAPDFTGGQQGVAWGKAMQL